MFCPLHQNLRVQDVDADFPHSALYTPFRSRFLHGPFRILLSTFHILHFAGTRDTKLHDYPIPHIIHSFISDSKVHSKKNPETIRQNRQTDNKQTETENRTTFIHTINVVFSCSDN